MTIPLSVRRLFVGALLGLLTLFLTACTPHSPSNDGGPQLLRPIYSLEDTHNQLTPEQALTILKHGADKRIFSHHTPSFGFRDTPHWFLLTIDNDGESVKRFLLAGMPHTDYINLYLYDSDETPLFTAAQGDRLPWSTRLVDDNEPVFPLWVPARQTSHILLRIQTTGTVKVPVTLLNEQKYFQHKFSRQISTGLYFGAILAMCLFNLLLYGAIRDHSYLLYVVYLLAMVAYLAARASLSFQLFWPETPWLNDTVRAFSAITAQGFAILFAVTFLQLRSSHRYLANTFIGFALSFIVAALLSWLFNPELTLQFAAGLIIIAAPIILLSGIIRLLDGFKPARYFLLSFMPLGILVTLFGLKTFTLVDSNWLIDHAVEVGTTLEALLLSFALAYRLTMLKTENTRIQKIANSQLEERVQERTEELNQALNARSEFLAVMSHEIRTPLNGILGTVDILKDSRLDTGQQQQIHLIEQSGNTLLELLNDILDYSRIDDGKLPIHDEQFNLPGLLRESVALFEQQARINGNKLTLELDQNIGLLCHGDPLRLRQVLINLISNAIKFTKAGQVVVYAKRDTQNEAYALFEIHDSGIGIQKKQQSLLFESFQQGDASTRRHYGGVGLGLAISRQLVELMGGEIGADSEVGQGSTFWFRLPLPAVSQDQRLAQKNEDMNEQQTPPVRLLIVDDNHINLLVAQGLARKLRHEVEVAESGPEALAVLLNDSKPFDLILMDCEMPEMDGFETSREIIRLQNEGKIDQIPIVALTAHAVPDKIRLCHEAGMVSHIAKPINSDKLDRKIRSVLRSTNRQLLSAADQR